MKVIIILDYMAQNGLVPPNPSTLKKYGHNLIALLSSARDIRATGPLHPLAVIEPGSIEYDILSQLSDFAEACGRYANLDALASGKPPRADPLTVWKMITERILDEDVSESKKEQAGIWDGVVAALLVAMDDRSAMQFSTTRRSAEGLPFR